MYSTLSSDEQEKSTQCRTTKRVTTQRPMGRNVSGASLALALSRRAFLLVPVCARACFLWGSLLFSIFPCGRRPQNRASFGSPNCVRQGDLLPSAHYTRLMHVGWGQCGHGLSSRPHESGDHHILTPLLDFFGYPDGAATELFRGTLKLRFSSSPFPKRFPSWPVPDLSDGYPVVGCGPGPVIERPAKRFRITGKSSGARRALDSRSDLPTP